MLPITDPAALSTVEQGGTLPPFNLPKLPKVWGFWRSQRDIFGWPGAIANIGPIHGVQGKLFADRVDHGVALLVVIDEFALIGRTDIEFAAISSNTAFPVVAVVFNQLADGQFFWVQFSFGCRLLTRRRL